MKTPLELASYVDAAGAEGDTFARMKGFFPQHKREITSYERLYQNGEIGGQAVASLIARLVLGGAK